jgi:hypothetical protein
MSACGGTAREAGGAGVKGGAGWDRCHGRGTATAGKLRRQLRATKAKPDARSFWFGVLLACGLVLAGVGPCQADGLPSGPAAKLFFVGSGQAGNSSRAARRYFLGFDRNRYPGDAALAGLRKRFQFCGYWLNTPPSEKSNSWKGKRRVLRAHGFGFLVIWGGRADAELLGGNAEAMGREDARQAAAGARGEGFSRGTVIFLDQEEGGRLLAEQRAYVLAWADGIFAAGFSAGIYCSGVPVNDGGKLVTTAQDLRENAGGRKIVYWVYNSLVPPSAGCVFPARAPAPSRSGVTFSDVWQFAESPAPRATSGLPGYDADGSCYAPGFRKQRLHVDVDAARTPDPSRRR